MAKNMKFTKEQNKIWETLFKNQIANVKNFACREYLDGFELLSLPKDKVPSLAYLNQRITPLTGWKVIRSKIRYSDTLPWYKHFAKHEFIITNYLRSREELEFTPEPDMFHDIFGHLPFLTLPKYTELFNIFTKAYFSVDEKHKEDIKRLGWFTYEFGLIKENGKIKIFGTGILSSRGETKHVMSGKTPILPFSIEKVLERNKAIDTFNRELFVFDSLESLKRQLREYFDKLPKNKRVKSISKMIIRDKEMDLSAYK